MWCKVVAVVVLSFASGIKLEEIYEHDFSVVSSTQRSSEYQQLKDRLTSFENKWEFQSKLNENNRRLEALEIQTNQTLNLLENMNFALTNITSQHTKHIENNHQSEVLQLKIEQILKKLENINLELENLKNQHTKLEIETNQTLTKALTNITSQHAKHTENNHQSEVQLQNEQILKKLENISQELENLKNQHPKLQTVGLQNNLKDPNFTLTNRYQFSPSLPKSCKEVKQKCGSLSTAYLIKPEVSSEPFPVWCDMETRGGGWTYVLNRFDGSQDFYLNWADYKKGFGNLSGEFWIGLDHLYQLTGQEPKELLVELVDWNQAKPFAHFDKFSIGNEEEGYILKIVGNYTGDAGDSMSDHVGMKFSTKDRDHDLTSGKCSNWEGAWWYKACFQSHLTGKYRSRIPYEGQWFSFRNSHKYNFKMAKMMIR